jgi:hypothetical protein
MNKSGTSSIQISATGILISWTITILDSMCEGEMEENHETKVLLFRLKWYKKSVKIQVARTTFIMFLQCHELANPQLFEDLIN